MLVGLRQKIALPLSVVMVPVCCLPDVSRSSPCKRALKVHFPISISLLSMVDAVGMGFSKRIVYDRVMGLNLQNDVDFLFISACLEKSAGQGHLKLKKFLARSSPHRHIEPDWRVTSEIDIFVSSWDR